MRCFTLQNIASCFPLGSVALRRHKPAAAREIPDSSVCAAPGWFILIAVNFSPELHLTYQGNEDNVKGSKMFFISEGKKVGIQYGS